VLMATGPERTTTRVKDLAGALLIVTLTLMMQPITTAEAALANCGSAGQHFSGRIFNPSGYQSRGSEAEIDIRSGPLCESGNGPSTFSTSWVMLQNDEGMGGYAQVGHFFKNFGQENHRFFYEFRRSTAVSFTRVLWGDPVFGNHHNFRASRRTSDGHVVFTVEDNNPPGAAETNFDPLNAWPGTKSAWSSEVLHIASDVPGTPTAKTNFQFVHHKNSSETWQLQNYVGVVPTKCYFPVSEVTNNSHFRSWTSNPNHTC